MPKINGADCAIASNVTAWHGDQMPRLASQAPNMWDYLKPPQTASQAASDPLPVKSLPARHSPIIPQADYHAAPFPLKLSTARTMATIFSTGVLA
jgi:hypothetical protein